MKVLHVTQGYAPARGGTELLIQRASEDLVRQFNDEVTVFTTDCYNGEGPAAVLGHIGGEHGSVCA